MRRIEDAPCAGKGKFLTLLFGVSLLMYGNSAQAQSVDGFIDTIKGMVKDPVIGSMLKAKAASLIQGKIPGATYGIPANGNLPQGSYGIGDSSNYGNPYAGFNSVPSSQSSGFYSMEEGAPLGGIGYDSSLSAPNRTSAFNRSSSGYDSYPAPMLLPKSNLSSMIPGIMSSLGGNPGGTATSMPADSQMTITKKLAPAELKRLSQFDISVLIDRSGSMNDRDCPDIMSGGAVSRWEWCRQQTAMLAQQTAGALPAGLQLFHLQTNGRDLKMYRLRL